MSATPPLTWGVVDELMRLTDDNCGTTCGTACPATGC
ncbi:MAG: FxLD family lanthipeptide [Pseudonocardiaceae bacterium]